MKGTVYEAQTLKIIKHTQQLKLKNLKVENRWERWM
jgi:hypothetical protein